MLTQNELATVRAALRFWRDEMVTADRDTRRHYFDLPSPPTLSADEIESLIVRLRSPDFGSRP